MVNGVSSILKVQPKECGTGCDQFYFENHFEKHDRFYEMQCFDFSRFLPRIPTFLALLLFEKGKAISTGTSFIYFYENLLLVLTTQWLAVAFSVIVISKFVYCNIPIYSWHLYIISLCGGLPYWIIWRCWTFLVTLHKKWCFAFRISSVNVTKFAGNWWKTSFFYVSTIVKIKSNIKKRTVGCLIQNKSLVTL